MKKHCPYSQTRENVSAILEQIFSTKFQYSTHFVLVLIIIIIIIAINSLLLLLLLLLSIPCLYMHMFSSFYWPFSIFFSKFNFFLYFSLSFSIFFILSYLSIFLLSFQLLFCLISLVSTFCGLSYILLYVLKWLVYCIFLLSSFFHSFLCLFPFKNEFPS